MSTAAKKSALLARLGNAKNNKEEKPVPVEEEKVVEEVDGEVQVEEAPKPTKKVAAKKVAVPKETKPKPAKKVAPPKEETTTMDSVLNILSGFKSLTTPQRKAFKTRLTDSAEDHAAAARLASLIQEIASIRVGKTLIRKLDDELVKHLSSLDLGVSYVSTKEGNKTHINATETSLQDAMPSLNAGYTTQEHISLLIKVLPLVIDIKTDKPGSLPTSKVLLLDQSWAFLDSTVDSLNKGRTTALKRERITPRDLALVFTKLTSEVSDEEREAVEEEHADQLVAEKESLELVVKHYESLKK